MNYIAQYPSPIGLLTIASDGESITGLWIHGQKHFGKGILPPYDGAVDFPVTQEAKAFLDAYFRRTAQTHSLPLRPSGTPFQQQVWSYLLQIPYGETVTYGDIARHITMCTGKSMSAQAVGNAVGRNPIAILIPCHRVVGANGDLTGYAAGLSVKKKLLKLENAIE